MQAKALGRMWLKGHDSREEIDVDASPVGAHLGDKHGIGRLARPLDEQRPAQKGCGRQIVDRYRPHLRFCIAQRRQLDVEVEPAPKHEQRSGQVLHRGVALAVDEAYMGVRGQTAA
eukprot:378245-Prymnesium_polylepis.1